MVEGDFLTGGRTGDSLMVGDFFAEGAGCGYVCVGDIFTTVGVFFGDIFAPGRIGDDGRLREVLADGRGEGGRLREREARGERPILEVLVVRSMGERGEVRRERPTGPIGEQWMVRW